MVKIEVEVIDKANDSCNITIKKPKFLKNATDTEKKTANVVKMTIDNAIESLSKSK